MNTSDSAYTQTALVFPGQGSQAVGMLAELAAVHPLVEQTFAEASAALDYDLWHLVSHGPAEQLNNTTITQPALLTAGMACWRVLQAETLRAGNHLQPDFLAGHSLGEYTALTAAGAIDFATAVTLVAERGRLMQSAAPEGAGKMAAIIGLDDMAVLNACHQAQALGTVSAANFNSPGQVVIAGAAAAVDAAIELCKEAGARRAMPLPVSVPSHCALMRPAAEQLGFSLRKLTLQKPEIPVLHNVDAQLHNDADDIAELLIEQLYKPVLWTQSVQCMLDQGVTRFVECGPGNVLGGLIKRIAKVHCADTEISVISLDDPQQLQALALTTAADQSTR
jgi:[acyl-carrier-protein] S-malonyltransferase